MTRRLHLTRSHAIQRITIQRIKRRLEQDSFPRMQMSLIVGLTGAAGLLFSFVMLELGVTSMALRYPLALLMAYGVFLVLLWLWLHTKAEDYVDIPDFSGLAHERTNRVRHHFFSSDLIERQIQIRLESQKWFRKLYV